LLFSIGKNFKRLSIFEAVQTNNEPNENAHHQYDSESKHSGIFKDKGLFTLLYQSTLCGYFTAIKIN
jgi:hypothetical protein